MTFDEVVTHAETMGIAVEWDYLGARHGELRDGQKVVLNALRSDRALRIILAHEIGHYWHGHDWRIRHDHERDEREAYTYGVHLLVSPEEYAVAEKAVGCRKEALAVELGLTDGLVRLWQDTRHRRVERLAQGA